MARVCIMVACALCLVLASPGLAQPTPEVLIDQFFTTYLEKGAEIALSELYGTNPWLERKQDEIDKLKNRFDDLPSLVGEYQGRELLVNRQLGDCYTQIIYIAKYDRQPICIYFEFYKPEETWRLYSFSYDDEFDTLINNFSIEK